MDGNFQIIFKVKNCNQVSQRVGLSQQFPPAESMCQVKKIRHSRINDAVNQFWIGVSKVYNDLLDFLLNLWNQSLLMTDNIAKILVCWIKSQYCIKNTQIKNITILPSLTIICTEFALNFQSILPMNCDLLCSDLTVVWRCFCLFVLFQMSVLLNHFCKPLL